LVPQSKVANWTRFLSCSMRPFGLMQKDQAVMKGRFFCPGGPVLAGKDNLKEFCSKMQTVLELRGISPGPIGDGPEILV
jgi:hypothetical protein